MGIEIILYDSSPVVQKIFHHVLYHYRPTVHRIDDTSKLVEKIQYNKPDIIFIDFTFSQDIKKQLGDERFKNIPVILMAKTELNPEALQASSARDFLQKPISADKLRNLVTRFVPKAKRNILNKHLKFPPIPDFVEAKGDQSEKTVNIQQDSLYTMQSTQQPPAGSIKPGGIKPGGIKPGGIKPVAEFTEAKSEQSSIPVKAPVFSQAPHQPSEHRPSEEEGIKPITNVNFTIPDSEPAPPAPKFETAPEFEPAPEQSSTPVKAPVFSQVSQPSAPAVPSAPVASAPPASSSAPPASPPTSDSTSGGIKPVTGTNITKLEERLRETQIDDKKQSDQILYQPAHNTIENPNAEKTKQDDVKILNTPEGSPPSSDKKISAFKPKSVPLKMLPDEDITQLKNQIITDIKQWEKEQIEKEVTTQLKSLFDQSSQGIIQKIAEKAVWQVVPELSKKLITKKLNQLLDNEEEHDLAPAPLSALDDNQEKTPKNQSPQNENDPLAEDPDLDALQSFDEYSKLNNLDNEYAENNVEDNEE